MMEKATFTNIPTINYFIVRTAESLCKGHLVDLGSAFSVPITHKLLVRLYQYMTYSNNAHRHYLPLVITGGEVSFSATYSGSSHTLSLASSDQNFLYREYLLAALERLGPALPLSHDGGFSMIHGVRRQCGHALSPPSTGGSSPSPYPFSPINIIIIHF